MAKTKTAKPNVSMRSRTIKPSLFLNEELSIDAADPLLTLLFIGLWCMADREGRLADRPLKIKGKVFPLRTINDPDAMLQWLADQGFIVRYKVGGQRFIQILNFIEYQNPHPHEAASVIPAIAADTAMSLDVITCNDNGAPCNALTSFSSITSLPSRENGETPSAAVAAVENDPVERRIWSDGVGMLKRDGTSENAARSLLGRLAKNPPSGYGKLLLAEAIAVTQAENPAAVKEFLIKTLKTRDKAKATLQVGKHSDEDEEPPVKCKTCFDMGFLRKWPDESKQLESVKEPCPDCSTKK